MVSVTLEKSLGLRTMDVITNIKESARFLLRNNLFLLFRHHFVIGEAEKDGKGSVSGEKKGLNSQQKKTGPAAVLQGA